jgi:Leucine-rich repeat (LRR) protein
MSKRASLLHWLLFVSMLFYFAVPFPVSQEPCFASWSHSELESYAHAAWSSSVAVPVALDQAPCHSSQNEMNPLEDDDGKLGNLQVSAAELPMEEVGNASDDLTYDTLMTFYDSTGGPSWTYDWNWGNRNLPACHWYGVCCNMTGLEFLDCPPPDWESGNFSGSCCSPTGIVRGIYLLENNLRGTIPPALGQLSTLSCLDLKDNFLSGTIPADLGQLKELTVLKVVSNQMSGTIPPDFIQLTALKILVAGFNQLSGTIPSFLTQLPALERIGLAANLLTGTIPAELAQLQNLTTLILRVNQLSGEIPPELGQMKALTHLDLSVNDLSGTIPPALGSLHTLEVLELFSNRLSGTVPSAFEGLPFLSRLNLNNNLLTGVIPTGFRNILYLGLASNRYSGTIPADLAANTNLQQLYLSNNTLTGTIPREIFEMPQLRILKLAGNQLSGELTDSPHVCTSVGSQLNTIDLSFNELSGSLRFFQYFSELTVLNIRHNALSGPIALTMQKISTKDGPCAIEGVSSILAQLDVSQNAFTELMNVPSSIGTFSAARCALSGSVAPLNVLVAATFIDVQDNPNLTGEIPIEIVRSRFLLYLFINNTKMQAANPSSTPGLILDPDRLQTFGTGQNQIECPRVFSEASPNAALSISAEYFSYRGCSCGLGFAGPDLEDGGATCERCPLGTYNDEERLTFCKDCPAYTYADVKGSYECHKCDLPLHVVLDGGKRCWNLTYLYILTFLFIFLTIIALISLIAAVVISVMTGYRLLKWWKSRELHRVTALIEMRARDEIPADLLIRYRDLKMDNVIGTGSFARVFRGSWNRTLVAIKELTAVHSIMASMHVAGNGDLGEDSQRNDAAIQKLVSQFKSEVLVMSRLHHPNVLLLVGACSTFPNLCIVTEYLSNGSLYDALHRKHAAERITLTQQFQWLGETANGMAYLHDQGLMHRDLKSPNVLLDDVNRAKLCDFGLARMVGDVQRTMTGGVGSVLWMAPEVMMDAIYDYSADVFAWGILAWEIMSPEVDLFPGKSVLEVSRAVIQGKRPPLHPSWPVGVCEVMVMCWGGVAEERPTFGEVVGRLEPIVGVRGDVTRNSVAEKGDDLRQPLLLS